MSSKFTNHVQSLQPGTLAFAEFAEAATSVDGLLAYSDSLGLDLSRADAKNLLAKSQPLQDGDLDSVAGGFGAPPLQDQRKY